MQFISLGTADPPETAGFLCRAASSPHAGKSSPVGGAPAPVARSIVRLACGGSARGGGSAERELFHFLNVGSGVVVVPISVSEDGR